MPKTQFKLKQIEQSGAANGNIPSWNGTNWVATAPFYNNVTANRLLGRVGTNGIVQEITLGTGLSFSGTTLNGNTGTVTGVTLNNFSPLFTVANTGTATAPAFTFTAVSQSAKTFYAAPTAAAGNPLFRTIVPTDLGTGTPSATTFLQGDGTWQPISNINGNYVLKAGDTMTGALIMNDASFVRSNAFVTNQSAKVIKFPAGATYSSATGNDTGAIVIKHPNVANTMVTLVIKFQDYATASDVITIKAWWYTSAGVFTQLKPVMLEGNNRFNSQFRLGYDGAGNQCLIIGDVTTAHSSGYIRVWVEEAQVAFTGAANASWNTGWAITLETDLSAYTAVQSLTTKRILDNVYANTLYEVLANKATSFTTINNTLYPTVNAVAAKFSNGINTVGAIRLLNDFTQFDMSPANNDWMWHDAFAFGNQLNLFETTTDFGTNWTTATANLGLFDQKQAGTGTTILTNTSGSLNGIRLKWTGFNFGQMYWILTQLNFTGTNSNYDMLIEESVDNATWSPLSTFTNVAQSGATTGAWRFQTQNTLAYLRVTFMVNSSSPAGATTSLKNVRGMALRAGNQGFGKEYEYPYSWTEQKYMRFTAPVYTGTIALPSQYRIALLDTSNGNQLTSATLDSVISGSYIKQGGNSFGVAMSIGTNDNFPINIRANNAVIGQISVSGNYYGNGLGNFTAGAAQPNNALINVLSTGISMARNIGDSNTAVAINQVHVSSTGDILQLLDSGTVVAKFTNTGNLMIPNTVSSGAYNLVVRNTATGILETVAVSTVDTNFGNTNITATDHRFHNFNNKTLDISNISDYHIFSTSTFFLEAFAPLGLQIYGGQIGNSSAFLKTDFLTSSTDRTYQFPNASGTLALLTDIPGTPSLQQVATVGNNYLGDLVLGITGNQVFVGSGTVGSGNTRLGHNTLLNNISGSFNTAIGSNSMANLQYSSNNIAMGEVSLASYIGATSASGGNIAIGVSSMNNITDAQANVAVGVATGNSEFGRFGGRNNVFLGNSAGNTWVTSAGSIPSGTPFGDFNILIGTGAGSGIDTMTQSYQLRIGYRINGIGDHLIEGNMLSSDPTLKFNGRLFFRDADNTTPSSSTQYLVRDSSTKEVLFLGSGQIPNIYNSDGTLNSNRFVSGNSIYDLYFQDINNFWIDSTLTANINVENDINLSAYSGNITIVAPGSNGISLGSGGPFAVLKTQGLSVLRTFQFPDADGTLALTSQIVPDTNFGNTNITATGNRTHNFGGNQLNISGTNWNISGQPGALALASTGGLGLVITASSTNSFIAQLFSNLLTGSRSYQLPDANGTFALTSQLTGGTVTSIAAGAGMNFTTFSTTGSIVMGTPSAITLSSTNSASGTTHTHAFTPGGTTAQYISGAGTLITFPTIPAQVNLTQGTGISITGTYPNLTITNSSPNATHTGDVSGATVLTLATVNSNIGTFNNVTVNAKGLVTAASNVAYLTANQTITLSGDVTGSGATSIATTIANGVVTYAKIQNVTANRLLGRTATSGSIQELTLGSNLSFSGTTLNVTGVVTTTPNLTWNGATGNLSIAGGNTVNLDGRYITNQNTAAQAANAWITGSYQAANGFLFTRNLTDQTGRRNWGMSTEVSSTGDWVLAVSSTNTGTPTTTVIQALNDGSVNVPGSVNAGSLGSLLGRLNSAAGFAVDGFVNTNSTTYSAFRFGNNAVNIFGYLDSGGGGITNSSPYGNGALIYLTGSTTAAQIAHYVNGTNRMSVNNKGMNIFGAMQMNKSTIAASGISFFEPTYNAWQIYMAQAGSVGNGVNGNVVPQVGGVVTTWALRSFIENTAGYGWTWESGANNATTPNIVAELSSNTGNLRLAGYIRAGNLTGNVVNGIYSDADGVIRKTDVAPAIVSNTTNASVGGWYSIAYNGNSGGTTGGDRATGKFTVVEINSGKHQTLTFYASYHFGTGWNINLLNGGQYQFTTPIFNAIRILGNSTYNGAELQINLNSPSAAFYIVLEENYQTSGWNLMTPTQTQFIPGLTQKALLNLTALSSSGGGVVYPVHSLTGYVAATDWYRSKALSTGWYHEAASTGIYAKTVGEVAIYNMGSLLVGDAPGYGSIRLVPGNGSNAGYMAVVSPAGAQLGYVGYNNNVMNYQADQSYHLFTAIGTGNQNVVHIHADIASKYPTLRIGNDTISNGDYSVLLENGSGSIHTFIAGNTGSWTSDASPGDVGFTISATKSLRISGGGSFSWMYVNVDRALFNVPIIPAYTQSAPTTGPWQVLVKDYSTSQMMVLDSSYLGSGSDQWYDPNGYNYLGANSPGYGQGEGFDSQGGYASRDAFMTSSSYFIPNDCEFVGRINDTNTSWTINMPDPAAWPHRVLTIKNFAQQPLAEINMAVYEPIMATNLLSSPTLSTLKGSPGVPNWIRIKSCYVDLGVGANWYWMIFEHGHINS